MVTQEGDAKGREMPTLDPAQGIPDERIYDRNIEENLFHETVGGETCEERTDYLRRLVKKAREDSMERYSSCEDGNLCWP